MFQVLNAQAQPALNGIDIRTEPKFNLPNGDLFTNGMYIPFHLLCVILSDVFISILQLCMHAGWCRPQNDGPGLRATTLMMYANSLFANGRASYVTNYLWTGDNNKYKGGAIKVTYRATISSPDCHVYVILVLYLLLARSYLLSVRSRLHHQWLVIINL